MNLGKFATISAFAFSAAPASAFSLSPSIKARAFNVLPMESAVPRLIENHPISMKNTIGRTRLEAQPKDDVNNHDHESAEPNHNSEIPDKLPDTDKNNSKQSGKKSGRSKLFGLDESGNKITSTSKNTRDGNEMDIGIGDGLSDCYPVCDLEDMKYTVNHDDLSGRRQLSIDKEYLNMESSVYHQIMRDTVFAEWVPDEDGRFSLFIKMHLTENSEGEGPLWEKWVNRLDIGEQVKKDIIAIGGELRKNIFQSHEEDAVEVIFTVIRDILHDNPHLLESKMFVHYLSDIESLREISELGTIGERLAIVERYERSGKFRGNDPWSKNIEVWKDSVSSLKYASGRFVNDVLPKLIAAKVNEVDCILTQTLLMDMLVLMLMMTHKHRFKD